MVKKSTHIDALRGAAILAVVVYHYVHGLWLGRALGLPAAAARVAEYGWAGVDLFFVLSAYLLARNLLAHRDAPRAAQIFYLRRMFRVLPMYLVMLAAAFIVGASFPMTWLFVNLAPFWVYAGFLQNFWDGLHSGWGAQFLGPTWSLAIEEHFYLFLPLFVLRLAPRGLLIAALSMIALSPLLRFAIAGAFGGVAAYTFTFCRLDSFGWGLVIALAPRLNGAIKVLIAAGWLASVFSVVATLLSRDGAPTGGFLDPAVVSATTLLAAAIVASVVLREERRNAAASLPLRALAFMGERCFSIYLLHIPIAGLMALAFGHARPEAVDASSTLALAIAFPYTLAVASLTWRYVERPFMDLGDRVARYRDAEVGPAQASPRLSPAAPPG